MDERNGGPELNAAMLGARGCGYGSPGEVP